MTAPDKPAVEPMAWRYRWKLDGEWVNWRVSDASQKTPNLKDLEEHPLVPAALLEQALADVERLTGELAEAKRIERQTFKDAGAINAQNDALAAQVKTLEWFAPFAEERRKQIAKGYTDEHDDEHVNGEILAAALCYLRPHATYRPRAKPGGFEAVREAVRDVRRDPNLSTLREVAARKSAGPPAPWPWEAEAWRPKTEADDLRRAITMLIAEYHRRARTTLTATDGGRNGG